MPRLLATLPALLSCLALPAGAEVWHGDLAGPGPRIDVPAPFRLPPAFADSGPGGAIVEFLPEGDSLQDWSQMLTLTAAPGLAGGQDAHAAAVGMAEGLRQGYSNACPGGLGVEDLGSPAMPGAEAAFAAWLGCDEVGDSGFAESMVVLVVVAGGTTYTAQWAERGPAVDAPPIFNFERWLPRLEALMTFAP